MGPMLVGLLTTRANETAARVAMEVVMVLVGGDGGDGVGHTHLRSEQRSRGRHLSAG